MIDAFLNRETHTPLPVDARSFGCHTAVLAQSGSGKSFLIGRLIEELLIKTKARVVVLDPNSDFVRIPEIDAAIWASDKLRPWFFPNESLDTFRSDWTQANTRVLSNRNLPNTRPLRIGWGGLSDVERANVMGLDPAAQPELYWASVLIGEVTRSRWEDDVEPDYDFQGFRSVAEELCDFLLSGDGLEDISQHPLAGSLRSLGPGFALRLRVLVDSLANFDIWRSVGDNETDVADILTVEADSPSATVIDLLSLDTDAERLAISTRALAAIWASAREAYGASLRDIDDPDRRVPTFLVIDEAHNVVPVQRLTPAAERLAAEVLKIAAEGRKFGLFLVVATQRPRKLDPSILTECDALILMKMTNYSDMGDAAEVFGFIDSSLINKAKTLGLGDLFLQGRLSRSTDIYHVAPRRTKQGGRSLDDNYWTAAFDASLR